MNKENFFQGITKDGIEVEYEILFTCESDETGKHYMIYTDNALNEIGDTKVYASIFDPTQENIELEPITNEKEWKIIEDALEYLQKNKEQKNEE